MRCLSCCRTHFGVLYRWRSVNHISHICVTNSTSVSYQIKYHFVAVTLLLTGYFSKRLSRHFGILLLSQVVIRLLRRKVDMKVFFPTFGGDLCKSNSKDRAENVRCCKYINSHCHLNNAEVKLVYYVWSILVHDNSLDVHVLYIC